MRAPLSRLRLGSRRMEITLFAAQGLGLLSAVGIARLAGPEGRGQLTTLAVYGQILGWLTAGSLDKALIVMTRDKVDPDRLYVAAAVRRLSRMYMIVGLCVALPIGVALFEHYILLGALVATVVVTARLELRTGWILATGRENTYLWMRVAQPAIYGLGVTALLVADTTGVIDVADVAVPAVSLLLVVSIMVPTAATLRNRMRVALTREGSTQRRVARFALKTQAGALLQYLNTRLDLLVLPLLVSAESVGQYAVAASLSSLLLLLSSAGNLRGLIGGRASTDRLALAVVITAAAAIIISAPALVPILFGNDFQEAVGISQVLAVGAVFGYMVNVLSGQMIGDGRSGVVVAAQAAGVASFAIGLVIAGGNLVAVALCSGTAWTLTLAMLFVFRGRHTRRNPGAFSSAAVDLAGRLRYRG